MKNWLLTLLLAAAAAVASYGAFYVATRETPEVRAARAGDALEWLRAEFKLTDAQYTAIKDLHDHYGTICAGHCSAIRAAEKRHAPRLEVAALENECVQSMTEHFKRVAGHMSPDQAQRYLAMVLPRVHDYDHRGAPDVRGHP